MPRAASRHRPPAGADRLTDLAAGFANPGALDMRVFVPAGLAAGAPLVVVLHGCTQTAAGYDHGAGWSRLAEQLGFALLFPEQRAANNANGCFNWFEPDDTRRGAGEAASIAAAVAAVVAAHRLDPTRVFISGLSAGGAMATVMLATYPDVFAGGAIVAGLPYGTAAGVGAALQTMARPAAVSPRHLGDRVRAASSYAGPWPRVVIWHGDADRTVSIANGEAIAAQWADVHGAVAASADRAPAQWRNAAGVAVVEFHRVAGMGHGTPIDAADGGVAAPFILDVGIASSAWIAAFWGLGGRIDSVRASARPRAAAPRTAAAPAPHRPGFDVGRLINDTLRRAGLMR